MVVFFIQNALGTSKNFGKKKKKISKGPTRVVLTLVGLKKKKKNKQKKKKYNVILIIDQ